MENTQHNEHRRTQFQIDRIAFFSDAVIAIAITLMILEIKIPVFGKDSTIQQILDKYGSNMILHIVALLICYMSIANLWMRHHELFEHIINYNKSLIRFNLYFLLTIMLLPVSVSFLFEQNNPPQMQMMIFFVNLFLCNLTYYLMLLVIYNSKNKFSSIDGTEAAVKSKRIAFHVTLMFLMVIIVVIFWRRWFLIPFVVWPLVVRLIERFSKKHKKTQAAV